MRHSLKTYLQLATCIALVASCSRQKKPQDIPFNVDQAMELYGVNVQSPDPIDPNKVLITVDGEPITQNDLKNEALKLLRTVDQKNIPPERLQQIQQKLLVQAEKNIIQKKVLLNAVKKSDIIVSNEQIEGTLEQTKKALPENLSFQTFMTERNLTEDGLRASIESEIKLRLFLEQSIKKATPPTPEAIRTFYTENPDQFNIPEQINARHILVKLPPKPSGQEFIEKKNKIKALYKRLQDGEKFETLIAVESEDTSPSGALSVMTKGSTLPAIETAVFALEPGEYSEPVKTEHGFHILQVQKKSPPKTINFEEAMPQISAFLNKQAQQKTMINYINGLMNKASIERVTPKSE